MSADLDAIRTAIRRRAIAEDWTATRIAVAEDLADTARDDGTHALRSVEDASSRLGVSPATVKRTRKQLVEDGVLALRSAGGRGRGANRYDLATCSREQMEN